jgi:hypothetical protein
MNEYSRRQFLQSIGAAAGLLVAGRHFTTFAAGKPSPFEMLVVGDSHISGQGLKEQNKFYYLVKEWVKTDIAGPQRGVNMKVKAHSGSRLELHPEEIEKMREAGDDPNQFHHPEANLSQPSVRTQIDFARGEYDDPGTVDLVMLSGGITDVLVANTVNPFLAKEKLKVLIHKYCNEEMHRLLDHATQTFPNAQFAVIGYFPIISTASDMNQVARYFFKTVKFPHPLHFTMTNGMSRQLLKVLRKRMAMRSRFWVSESNREIRSAIAAVNTKLGQPRITFVESPITEQTCFGTRNSLLWGTDDDNFPADERYAERRTMCPEVFSELKYRHYGKMSVRMCELAAVGHPNVEGAKAFAEAIKNKLRPVFDSRRWVASS